jgi:hypothetical protein
MTSGRCTASSLLPAMVFARLFLPALCGAFTVLLPTATVKRLADVWDITMLRFQSPTARVASNLSKHTPPAGP